jgi:hypothetical protein
MMGEPFTRATMRSPAAASPAQTMTIAMHALIKIGFIKSILQILLR